MTKYLLPCILSAMNSIAKKTPLYDKHIELGGKVVDFAGWLMPVQYTSIMDEHQAVREKVGVFDISHMGQFFVQGEGSLAWLNQMLANNVEKLNLGQAQYTFLLNEEGGIIDDLIVYRLGEEDFFMIVNAAKIDEDYAWLSRYLPEKIRLTNHSDEWAAFAVQGPESQQVFSALFVGQKLPERNGVCRFSQNGRDLIVCRTGYTGEDGFELLCQAESAVDVLAEIIGSGAKPCGLGARDTLRLEMCYPLNGSDLSPEITPLESGLGFFVDMEKGDFIGRNVLEKQKEEGLKRRLVALQVLPSEQRLAPPRSHYSVLDEKGNLLGELTSGVLSPSLGAGIAMAYLPIEFCEIGTRVYIDVRGKKILAELIKKPFLKKG